MKTKLNETFLLKGKEHKERITPILCQLFDFELGHQAERLSNKIRGLSNKKFRLTIKEEKRKKTREALGFYFGGIVRACVMDSKGLRYDPEQIPWDWTEYKKKKLVSLNDIDNMDTQLRIEFFYEWKKTLRGETIKLPKQLSDKDNPELIKLIDNVMEWRIENGYPYLDVEKYKENRDGAVMV
jgi:hypothetical protein